MIIDLLGDMIIIYNEYMLNAYIFANIYQKQMYPLHIKTFKSINHDQIFSFRGQLHVGVSTSYTYYTRVIRISGS